MFVVGEAVIDTAVAQEHFCCDLEQCKGACCTLEGGRGAPLEDDEVLEITKAYPIVKQYLDEKNIQTIEEKGLVDGSPGDFATNCIENRECVFAYFENGIAQCSFEKAFLKGEIDWRKPLSCHLFPVRIRQFGKDFVRYEVINECSAGRAKGENERIPLYEFLKVPLSRKYGDAWYQKFLDLCKAKADNSVTV
ncbi:MAG: DUF3109 family protein [bacterium]